MNVATWSPPLRITPENSAAIPARSSLRESIKPETTNSIAISVEFTCPGPLGRRKADQTDTKIKRQTYCDSCEHNAVDDSNDNAKWRFGLGRLFSILDETAKTEAALILLAMNACHRLARWLVPYYFFV